MNRCSFCGNYNFDNDGKFCGGCLKYADQQQYSSHKNTAAKVPKPTQIALYKYRQPNSKCECVVCGKPTKKYKSGYRFTCSEKCIAIRKTWANREARHAF